MHSLETRTRAISMCRSGIANAEVARQLGVPKGTIGAWKYNDRVRHPDMYAPTREAVPYCPRCHGATLDTLAYSYLLGMYLGDGCITRSPTHRVYALGIACDNKWPGIIEAVAACFLKIIPCASVVRRYPRDAKMTEVKVYSKHWPCLFPQHGPGMKHTRKIELTPWQIVIVEEYPEEFIRGLIHSDGCRITNWTTRIIAGEVKRYEYPRYMFSQVSTDIQKLFTDALDQLSIEWRFANSRNISIAKRDSVARLDTFVGPKY